ncbi:hypothetical protein BS47DRAFT_1370747 [Hydnum rufescens UP504]|uniref:WW domain-containing protein n=1 Tax=Hydnum rufescens UP504 TaxID=1448309 RepID=A0A9P6B808_9AGAM|nr:hypothetical protein BS47DRAFT_1370747 [Hydnum rufescens UP504]
MSNQAQQLPPGWIAEWNAEHQRYVFIESATGRAQWELPGEGPNPEEGHNMMPPAEFASPPQPHSTSAAHTKRRQYALGASPQFADAGVAPGGQLFTPGLAADGQPPYFAPPDLSQGYPHPQPSYGQQHALQPPYTGSQPVAQVADQFSQMAIHGQRPFSLVTTNLIGMLADPRELSQTSPEIRLPPNASISPNPSANADPSYMRSTLNAVPATSALLNKSKLPFALVLTPHRSLKEGDETIPVVSDTVIARCRRCRSYINPYVQFIDGGNRWKCCMCNMSNEVPQLFDWDQEKNQPADRWARSELNYAAVDFVAPTEYMVRPPQPPVYTFLIDVSHAAVQSGMVATATRTILESLDRLPNRDDRTKIAIICFDVALHFFSISPGSTESSMLVVSDLDDVFLPKPNDLLVNLTESRAGLEALLARIPEMFQESHAIGSALGPALQAAFKLTTAIGCKIIVLTASLPSLGAGALKNREDPKILGTISVDMFLFSPSYTDVATLNHLPHYTSGQTYYYPAFSAARPIGFEGIIRVRASKGLRMSSFHGNFFVRSTDLLSMPSIPIDQSYVIEVQIDDSLTAPFAVFQTAVLYTSCEGERRIRVITLALPTTNNLSELYASGDEIAIATFLSTKAVERTLTHKLEDARDAITNKLVDILGTYKSSMTASGRGASAQLAIADNMKLLPILSLGLLKHVGLRQSAQIPPDLRAYAQALLSTLPSQQLIPYIHPSFYSLHTMPPEVGTIGEQGVIMPTPLPLTSERLERHGLYLIEDGQTIFLWVGRDAVPQLVMDVFNLPSYAELRGGKATLPLLENSFSQRVNAVIAKTREMRRGVYRPYLSWALSALIQDRADQAPSYAQYLTQLKDRVNAATS